jgi:hypothetical protein
MRKFQHTLPSGKNPFSVIVSKDPNELAKSAAVFLSAKMIENMNGDWF